jgi:hypothetical protein
MTINPDLLVAQLYASRAQAEATITQIDATLAALGVPMDRADADAICTHPVELREDLTTMGGPLEWRCRACGFHSTTTDSEG